MTLGQQCAADTAIVHQRGTIHAFHGHCALHIPELADIIISAVHGGPAQEWVTDGLQGLLILHDPLPLMRMPCGAAVDERSHTRSPRLFQLQKKQILRSVALQENNKGSHSYAAHPEDL